MKTSFIRAFRVQPYGWHLYLFDNAEKWARFVARKTKTTIAERRGDCEGAAGITYCDGETRLIYVGVFDGEPGTLAHEMTHAAVRIISDAGMHIDASNDEPLAYQIGHLIDECIQKILEVHTRKTP